MGNEVSPELIRKYINKECTPEEFRLVEAWYASFESEPDPIEELSESSRKELRNDMFENIISTIQTNDKPARLFQKTPAAWIYSTVAGIAASVVFVIGLNWYPGLSSFSWEENTEVVFKNNSKRIRRTFLSDGSVVWLQPKTSITYPKKFEGDLREVHLKGEAFFEVTKDSVHPFVVYSGEVITKVLGTSFNIKAFENMPSVEVSVVTGKVTVRLADKSTEEQITYSDNRQVLLLPEQRAVFTENSQVLKKELINTESQNDAKIWEKVDVTFDNVPLQSVIQKLEKEYNVKIVLDSDALKNYLLKADFTGQNLPDILEMLEISLNVSYEIDSQKIIIKSNSH